VDALEIEDVAKSFGSLQALRSVRLTVEPGERRAIIGPNGAGKTTLFHVISGIVPPTRGRVRLFGQDVTTARAPARARLGLGRTFQITSLFPALTVRENVLLAVQRWRGSPWHLLRPARAYTSVTSTVDGMLERWKFLDRAPTPVSELSYGEQRQLEIVLALSSHPRLLLLDEPTAGLSPAETLEVSAMIAGLPADLTILLIEHDMDVVRTLARRVNVLHLGEVLADGSPEEIQHDPRVIEIYLGRRR
jgi:branched-chain amino acid transport system ATP-binding protein